GRFLTRLNERSAALVQRLPGASIMQPDAEHCATIGATLARMHTAGSDFPHFRANTRGHAWWTHTAAEVMPCLGSSDAELLAAEVAFQKSRQCVDLPRGVIHADLLRDNALFREGELTGVIDFYYACNDVLL